MEIIYTAMSYHAGLVVLMHNYKTKNSEKANTKRNKGRCLPCRKNLIGLPVSIITANIFTRFDQIVTAVTPTQIHICKAYLLFLNIPLRDLLNVHISRLVPVLINDRLFVIGTVLDQSESSNRTKCYWKGEVCN